MIPISLIMTTETPHRPFIRVPIDFFLIMVYTKENVTITEEAGPIAIEFRIVPNIPPIVLILNVSNAIPDSLI